jgi:hypothetical protein
VTRFADERLRAPERRAPPPPRQEAEVHEPTQDAVLALQRSAGNRAVTALIQRDLTFERTWSGMAGRLLLHADTDAERWIREFGELKQILASITDRDEALLGAKTKKTAAGLRRFVADTQDRSVKHTEREELGKTIADNLASAKSLQKLIADRRADALKKKFGELKGLASDLDESAAGKRSRETIVAIKKFVADQQGKTPPEDELDSHLAEAKRLAKSLPKSSGPTEKELGESMYGFQEFVAEGEFEEMEAADRAADPHAGHSSARHASKHSRQKAKQRVTTGLAPSGEFAPTSSSSLWLDPITQRDVRLEAQEALKAHLGIPDLKTPAPNGKTEVVVKIKHAKNIADVAYEGTSALPGKITDPTGATTKKGKVYDAASVLAHNVVRGTRTLFKWEPGVSRWIEVQHFPDMEVEAEMAGDAPGTKKFA